ncbi:Nif3-like dinuclear metal center hexameric protein [Kocuria flava]|uniref:GTP cyclohydrolase 1 type 2 homolog n=1 Tax=Kocuria flava TaxID=446860 RepID=A0A2N4T2Y2_9MICC|nr:Nif3-like dinuclear metal center hexameric protein [Kocuria flava]PLC12580.1 Nif3-like dinuclear metal center hexameric protein [Kocuria flava]
MSPSRTPAPAPALAEVLEVVEQLWPLHLQEPWDASGLVTGRPEQPVRRVLLAVDPVAEVVAEAVSGGHDLLLTHHPLLLRGVTSVAADRFKGAVVHELVENRCALLTCHTNADSAPGGVSDAVARAAGLTTTAPLVPHPADPAAGLGRVGELPEPVPLRELAERLARAVPASAHGVRVAGDPDAPVRRVAVCGGAGDSLFDEVRAAGADVYVTADLRHHPASEAREAATGPGGSGTPHLVDLSHFASEWLWLPMAAAALREALAGRGHDVEVVVSERRTDPWDFRLETPGPTAGGTA